MFLDTVSDLDHSASGSTSSTNIPATTLIEIKCPLNLDDSMINFSTYFPHTKFITALHHPVNWFQSVYVFESII
jgi:hypothetical protein